MRAYIAALTSVFALAACGQSDRSGNDLRAAADQSDPASAAVLEEAAENGSDPQVALEEAARAREAAGETTQDGVTLQARPNLPATPNRKDGTQPPDKVAAPVG